MDFNYLYYRQQVERMRAEKAQCDASRTAHSGLARLFEERIADERMGRVRERHDQGPVRHA